MVMYHLNPIQLSHKLLISFSQIKVGSLNGNGLAKKLIIKILN